ncbi:MAG: hypothetical protein P8X57_13420, partial [Cyclobacteriaceae bacterium]
SKTHNGWDEVYSLTAGYDIYQWIDQLSKVNGEIQTDGKPVVTISPASNIPLTEESWTIHSLAFDPEGQELTTGWSVNPSDPLMKFTAEEKADKLILRDFDAGTYIMDLTVQDTDGNLKQVSTELNVLESVSGYADIESADIFSYDPLVVFEETLADSNRYSFSLIGTDELNIRASGNASTNSIRFALDEVGDFRTETRTNTGYLGLDGNSDYVTAEGTFVLTITACPDNFCDNFGISRQYFIQLSSDALPVTFAAISAERIDREVHLEWTTATEYGNSHFEIFRWTANSPTKDYLGRTEKQAGTTGFRNYQFPDLNPPAGTVYYQVVNVDNNGSRQYADPILVGPRDNIQTVWPNPARPGEPVNIPVLSPGLKPSATTWEGKEKSVRYSTQNATIQLDKPGIYILSLPTDGGIVRLKLIVAD